MIPREKCLEWAAEAGFAIPNTFEISVEQFVEKEFIEALINRAYAEGQKDMREEAAKIGQKLAREEKDHAAGYGFGYLNYTVAEYAELIRNLKMEEAK